MNHLPYEDDTNWQEVLKVISEIRDGNDYSTANVDFIRDHLESRDDRIRGGAVLAAEGCLFEQGILDRVIEVAEQDDNPAIRKAGLRSLSHVIHEGVQQGLEDDTGASTAMDDAEEWDEIQTGNLQEEYLRVKNLLYGILEDDGDLSLQELALSALADLGFRPYIRDKIELFFDSGVHSSLLTALAATGRYPQYWLDELESYIHPAVEVSLLKEAISSAYSSNSGRLSDAIEEVLRHEDPEVLRFALLTLANIGKAENLREILQHFSLHENGVVAEAARDGIELYTRNNFSARFSSDLID